MHEHTSKILKDMDTLRPFILANKEQNAELRSILRRIIQHVESIQHTPHVSPEQYQAITALLTPLIDAEHGTLLKSSGDVGISTQDQAQLKQHVDERRLMLQSIQHDWPALISFINNSHGLLGKKNNTPDDLGLCVRELERHLREHLHADEQLRDELNQLIATLQSSFEGMLSVINEVGEDAPELKQAQDILKQELPKDPAAAQALLQKARSGLAQAGDKLAHASQSMRKQMQQQVSQMSDLSNRLQEAEAEARNDPLTGLANRRKLSEFLSALDENSAVSFIMVDIDHFKKINDRYGHDAGDDILTALAQVLTDSSRSSDMVARLGGEEFCIILPGADIKAAGNMAANLCQAVSLHRFEGQSKPIEVTISLGVTERKKGESAIQAIKRADEALYQSKQDGRNRVTLAR